MTFSEVKEPLHDLKTKIPSRATKGSAGYDFHLKETIILEPGETKVSWSDVKCELALDEVLNLHIRSSVGIKNKVAIANGVPVIDSDYFENTDNDGNIAIALYNYGTTPVTFKRGARIAQGVISVIRVRETVKKERTGGIGSTGK